MSARRFSPALEDRIVSESRQPGCDHAELCRRYGISRRTLNRWRDRASASEADIARRPGNGEAAGTNAAVAAADTPDGGGMAAAVTGERAPQTEEVNPDPKAVAVGQHPAPASGEPPDAGGEEATGIVDVAVPSAPVQEEEEDSEVVQAFWLDQTEAGTAPAVAPRPPPAPDRDSETRPVAVLHPPGWLGGMNGRSRQGREFWKPAGAVVLFIVLTGLFTYGPCLLVNRLIASLGAFAAYGLLLAGLTPLSAFILSQFFWKQLPGGLKKIRAGDILTAFLYLIAVILCNLGILIVPTLACFAINFVRGLF